MSTGKRPSLLLVTAENGDYSSPSVPVEREDLSLSLSLKQELSKPAKKSGLNDGAPLGFAWMYVSTLLSGQELLI